MRIQFAAVAVVAAALAGSAFAAPAKQRTISFSGYSWQVRSSSGKVGPGPNRFSSSTDNVWVDGLGRLHLRIVPRNGHWECAEIVNTQSLGYGTYTFTLDSPVDALDPNVVLGLFTWSDDPAYANRELDIEFSRWGDTRSPTNLGFTVQPYTSPGHSVRAAQPSGVPTSSHSFAWAPGSVGFVSSSASPAGWTYVGSGVPVPGPEHAHMNLWLFRGKAPKNGLPTEVVVKSFSYTPAAG